MNISSVSGIGGDPRFQFQGVFTAAFGACIADAPALQHAGEQSECDRPGARLRPPAMTGINNMAHLRSLAAAICCGFFLSVAFVDASAQTASVDAVTPAATVKPRPKVALVLSGGGARGFAHIGVLRALQEFPYMMSYDAFRPQAGVS